MADGLTDGDLRRQLLQLGAKTVGPITATTRPIYVKKLNHLKVAAKKANAAAPEPRRGRKLLGFSSDEGSEGEDSPGPAAASSGRRRGRAGRTAVTTSHNRDTRTNNNNNKETAPAAANNSFSLLGRRPLRRSIHDGANSHSFSMQASFNSSGGSSRGAGRRGADSHRAGVVTDQSHFDSSDSDVDSTDHNPLDDTDVGVEDEDSWGASPERVSVSTNTSPRLDDSSLFNRTLGRLGVWGGGSGRYTGGRRSELGGTTLTPRFDTSSSRVSPLQYGTSLDDTPSSSSSIPGGYLNHRATSSSTSRRGKTGLSTLTATTSNNPTPSTSKGGPAPSSSKGGPASSSSKDVGGASSLAGVRRRTVPNSNHVGSAKSAEDKLTDEDLILQQGFKTQDDPSGYNMSQYISVGLLLVVTLFFGVLAFYYIMSLYSTKIEVTDVPSRDVWMICPADKDAASSVECYPRDTVEAARDVVLALFDMLSTRAGDYECGRADRRNMTKIEARTRLVNKFGAQQFGDDGKKYNFMVAVHLIHKNPHWEISLYNGRGEVAVRHVDMEWMESQHPYLSLICRAQKAAMTACYVLAGLLVVLSLAGFCWWRLKRREEETRSMHHLVERIIDVMKGHHDKCQSNDDMQPYLAIPHVRDMLIAPKDRRRLQSRWDAAVKFLSANESRIRVETQKISGEEFAVWRWLQTHTNGKVWQGPAFGENRDANLPPNLKNFKFQCLKIRNMFDPDIECDDDWHVNIEDAILEKVSLNDAQHGIVHIAVDKTSREGCVYVKCASAPEAAKAYMALHGWWFDKNLVTVKYLRLERYYERYPDAVHATTPLSPSNNQRRSLSQPFHRSIYESC